MDVASWLRSLGLERYEAAFRDNEITEKVLPRLTAEDLKDLGVSIVGHRRVLLDAIADLRSDARVHTPAVAAAPARPSAATPTAEPVAEAVGERRYLTVLFCDLVGSTGLSAQLDAEDWRDLVGVYVDTASAAVTEMGGHVAKKLGDGLMALFGYPAAQENDAERAARAALSIQRALAEVNRKNTGSGKPALSARIGIETGPVVVDAAGEVYGDAPNIAARVQALAEPCAVLVTAGVQRQIAGLFVAEERGSYELKGVPEPVTLFRLVRASGGGRRGGQRHLTPLIGRDEEIAMLMRRWERARKGDGQLVLIVGEPGLGKSRLIEELRTRLRDTPHTWTEWSCSQLLQNTPLHPIGEWGRQRFGGPDVPAERQLADLENTLALIKIDPQNVPLLAPVLDIPLPKERLPDVVPEEFRRRQLAAMTNWVMAGARSQPLVLAIEDVHWADPSTLDFIKGIAERGVLAPLFLLITARPEFRPPWGMRSHHTTISLAPLDRLQVREMVAGLSARHALSNQIVEGVAERTGGVPLFIEEVTRLLLERGEQGGIQTIPPTLQQSLTARLDRLEHAREVAQIGAVIGRDFSYAILRAVSGMEDPPLQLALERLGEADILLVQGLLPNLNYRFKHALIQDAAYENLLKSRRQVLHRRVAEVLRDKFADIAAAEPEVLAYHFTQGALDGPAIEWWGKAGDQALRRSALEEAISHFGKAIEIADKLSTSSTPRTEAEVVSVKQRLRLQISYGQAVMWSRGYGADETKAAFTRARELATSADDVAERFAIYYGLWVGCAARGEWNLARKIAETFQREAAEAAQRTEAVVAGRALGLTCLWQGDFTEAQANLMHAMRMYDPEQDREVKFRFGMDSGACATAYLAHTSWQLGQIEQAQEFINEAVARAVESAHAPTLAQTYEFKTLLEIFRGDATAALQAADTVVRIGREHGLAIALGWGTPCLWWARTRLGELETGRTELRQAVAGYQGQGNKVLLPLFKALLAEVEAEGDGPKAASTQIAEALSLACETGEHWADAFLHRIRGEILLKCDPVNIAPAEEAFLTAIAAAREQKAKSFELRAAMSLARLWRDQGKPQQARELLAPVYGWFTEGFETRDLKEAKALLEQLAI
jgi:class 3 adenylate cyclase/predicted ATPase